jgi:hypothetical protein
MLLGKPGVEGDLRVETPVFTLLIEQISRWRRTQDRVGQMRR